ncbi:hypothetical protein M758_8G063800 [Ceratodon purpureus]|nr:hypothetical protein M758_8G063800 [Ceratodon purpureus]
MHARDCERKWRTMEKASERKNLEALVNGITSSSGLILDLDCLACMAAEGMFRPMYGENRQLVTDQAEIEVTDPSTDKFDVPPVEVEID